MTYVVHVTWRLPVWVRTRPFCMGLYKYHKLSGVWSVFIMVFCISHNASCRHCLVICLIRIVERAQSPNSLTRYKLGLKYHSKMCHHHNKLLILENKREISGNKIKKTLIYSILLCAIFYFERRRGFKLHFYTKSAHVLFGTFFWWTYFCNFFLRPLSIVNTLALFQISSVGPNLFSIFFFFKRIFIWDLFNCHLLFGLSSVNFPFLPSIHFSFISSEKINFQSLYLKTHIFKAFLFCWSLF